MNPLWLFIGLICFIASLVMFNDYRKSSNKKNRIRIKAKCIDILNNLGSECPVYEINFNNQKLTICNNSFIDTNTLTIGDTNYIYIKKDNPNDYIHSQNDSNSPSITYLFLGFLAFFFALVGLLVGLNVNNYLIVKVIAIFFLLFGIYIFYGNVKDFFIRLLKCRIKIEAIIIDRKTKIENSNDTTKTLHRYVYQFNYLNKTYKVSNPESECKWQWDLK